MPVPQIITVHNLTPNSIFISDLDQDFEIHPGQTVTATNYDTPDAIQASNELESAYRNGLVEVSLNGVAITVWPFLVPPGGGVTNVSASAPITSSGGATPNISTSITTARLVGRTTAGAGVMEEITVGAGLSLSAGTLTASGGTPVDNETPAGTIDGFNDTFTLAFTPIAGSQHLYKNGIRQKPGAGNDYTISGSTITFEPGNIPIVLDTLIADYRK